VYGTVLVGSLLATEGAHTEIDLSRTIILVLVT
jgi:hypothetical protein